MREKRFSAQNGSFYDVKIEIARPRTSICIKDIGKSLGHDDSPGKVTSLSRCDSIDHDKLATAHKRLKSSQQPCLIPNMKVQFGRDELPNTIPAPENF